MTGDSGFVSAQRAKLEEINRLNAINQRIEKALELARFCYQSWELGQVIVNLEQARMWANRKLKALKDLND